MKVILTLEVTGTVLLSIGSKKLMYLDNPKKLGNYIELTTKIT